MNLLRFFILSIFIGCNGGTIIEPPKNPKPKTSDYDLDILWKRELCQDTVYSLGHLVLNENYIYSFGNCGNSDDLSKLDLSGGVKNWGIDGFGKDINDNSSISIIQDQIFVKVSGSSIKSYSLQSGENLWTFTSGDYDAGLSFELFTFNNRLLVILRSKNHSYALWQKMVELDKNTGAIIDTLIELEKTETNYVNISNPIHYEHPSGNDWIIFKNRSKLGDVMAYDVTADSMVWQLLDVYDGFTLIYSPFMIIGDKLIFNIGDDITCLNVRTGELKWKNTSEAGIFHQRFNKYFFSDGIKVGESTLEGYIMMHDIEQGRLQWSIPISYKSAKVFKIHNGLLYTLTSEYIYCIEPYTGEVIYKLEPPEYENRNSSQLFSEYFDIDSRTGYLYCSDNYFTYCLDLNSYDGE